MRKGDGLGRLNRAKVLYHCSKTRFSQYEKYTNNDHKSIAERHRKLNKGQPLGAQGCGFWNWGWFHARSGFRQFLIGQKLVPECQVVSKSRASSPPAPPPPTPSWLRYAQANAPTEAIGLRPASVIYVYINVESLSVKNVCCHMCKYTSAME